MNLDNFWNKKIVGIFGMLYQLIPSVYLALMDMISTIVQIPNMKEAGDNNFIQCKTIIRQPNNIVLADNIVIGREVSITSEIAIASLFIGSNTVIGTKSILDYTGDLEIGKNCLFSEGVVIQTHHHGIDPRNTPQPFGLKIEDNVWIGMQTIILHNVNIIGKNSIVGACSVVTKDIPANVIVAGNPAKIIRKLYDEL